MAASWRVIALVAILWIGALSVSGKLISDGDAKDWGVYTRWCAKFGKDCAFSNGIDDRFRVFQENLRYINEHNSAGKHSYRLGLNQFADRTAEEINQRFLGLRTDLIDSPLLKMPAESIKEGETNEVPESLDWRELGAVTPVKDQASCGSCWAFSTTGSIEGINQIVTGKLVSVSEQELVDCDRRVDRGCHGGIMENAFKFVIAKGGLDTEDDYPYRANRSMCDKDKMNSPVVSIDGYKTVPYDDEEALLRAVAKQPVSVAIEGSGLPFNFYESGIFDGPCGHIISHAVLIVGYGSEDGVDYWIVKNSWGASWGDNGYIKMRRNTGQPGGLCSINTLPSYPFKNVDTPQAEPQAPEEQCDKSHKCPSGTTCCCRLPIGPRCLSWGCCSAESPLRCWDLQHCCPHEYPVCRPRDGVCMERKSGGGAVGIKKIIPATAIDT